MKEDFVPYWPSLEMVAEKWEAMAAQLGSFGCSFRLEVSGGYWSCTIYDPLLSGGTNAAKKLVKEEAIREAVANWEKMYQEARAQWA